VIYPEGLLTVFHLNILLIVLTFEGRDSSKVMVI
jgi:hypothetical protein